MEKIYAKDEANLIIKFVSAPVTLLSQGAEGVFYIIKF